MQQEREQTKKYNTKRKSHVSIHIFIDRHIRRRVQKRNEVDIEAFGRDSIR